MPLRYDRFTGTPQFVLHASEATIIEKAKVLLMTIGSVDKSKAKDVELATAAIERIIAGLTC